MAKWTWEVLMRTETTLQTESLPLRFIPCYKSGGRKSKLLREQQRSYLRPLAYNYPIAAILRDILSIHDLTKFVKK